MDTGTDNELDDAIIGNSSATNNDTGEIGSVGKIEVIDPASIKRGRGRPRKSESGTGSQSGSGSERKSGVGQEKRQAAKAPGHIGKTPISTEGLEKILFSIHAMASAAIMPELALSEGDAKELAEAIAGVNEFYSTSFDPKLLAWIGVVTVAGKIYAPRLIQASMRKSMERKIQRQSMQKPQPVVNKPQSEPEKKINPVDAATANVFSDPRFVSVPQE